MQSREQFLGGWNAFTLSWIDISGIAASSTDHVSLLKLQDDSFMLINLL